MADSPRDRLRLPLSFPADVWAEEVDRFGRGARDVAGAARRELEGRPERAWFQPCAVAGPDGTRLERCVKVYVPVGRPASEAPMGMVFELISDAADRVVLQLIAFGERHPARPARSVYERAHRRLHGRYPDH